MGTFFSFGLLLVGGRRNIVVTPARAFGISGLIMLVLLCPLSGIVEPGVGEIVRQTAFTLSDLVDEGCKVGAAPSAGARGAGSAKGYLLAAVALEGDVGRMPCVDLAERHFAVLVVRFDALSDLHHGLLLLSPPSLRLGVPAVSSAGSRVGSCPEFRREAGSGPAPAREVHAIDTSVTVLAAQDRGESTTSGLGTHETTSATGPVILSNKRAGAPHEPLHCRINYALAGSSCMA